MVVDVGANIGNHSCWFTKRFRHVVCVEPGKVAALILRANLLSSKSTNWDIFEGALGDRSSVGILNVINSQNLGSSQVLLAEHDREGEFPVLMGDELLSKYATSELPLELLKVDVEGFELAVLLRIPRGPGLSTNGEERLFSVAKLGGSDSLSIRRTEARLSTESSNPARSAI